MSPNQVLGDEMTDDTYRDDDEKKEKKNDKTDEKKKKKKSVVFKAISSSKGKAKQETSSEDEDLSFDKIDDEKMALFVKRFGKIMMKKGYWAEERSHHQGTRKNQGGTSSAVARIVLLLNAHTIVKMKMMTKRARRRTRMRRMTR
jgi:hypothetical protein